MPEATMDQVSCCIHRTLETIGVTQLRRNLQLKSSITREIGMDVEKRSDKDKQSANTCTEMHIFGSSVEGTTTTDLNSDIDMVFCASFDRKVEPVDSSLVDTYYCLMETEKDATPPGYAKLLVKWPDHLPRCFLTYLPSSSGCFKLPSTFLFEIKHFANEFFYYSNCLKKGKGELEISLGSCYSAAATHGPATTYNGSNTIIDFMNDSSVDVVIGVQANFWPQCANEWLSRERSHNWPSTDDISYLKTLGFFLVPVGHELSPQKDLEWRISFSKQERYLMLNLNDTQYKCYVLLKLVKEGIINNSKHGKVLKSYVCKTSLFYTIEETDPAIWTTDRLLECFLRCVQKLLTWVEEGVCPNYFIPEENMFIGKVFCDAKATLCQVLKDVFLKPVELLLCIKLDHFGSMMLNRLQQDKPSDLLALEEQANWNVFNFDFETLSRIGNNMNNAKISMFRRILSSNHSQVQCLEAHTEAIDFLLSIPVSVEPHAAEKQDFLDIIVEEVRYSLASHLVAMAITCTDLYFRDWYLCAAAVNFCMSAEGNTYSQKIKLANALCMTGHLTSMATILHTIESDMDDMLACSCRLGSMTEIRSKNWILKQAEQFDHIKKKVLQEISLRKILQNRVCTCVMFLPSELAVTPDPLRYEMFRYVGAPVGYYVPEYKKWYEWAVVDAKMMYVFLRAVAEGSSSNRSLADLEEEIVPFNLCHTETAYNIMGWIGQNIYKDPPSVVGMMYWKSHWYLDFKKMFRLVNIWEKREMIPRYNAAYWHMLVLIYQTQSAPLQH